MSYEYDIVLKSQNDYQQVWTIFCKSHFVVSENSEILAMKDNKIPSSWSYDLRLFKKGYPVLGLEITNWSNDLYIAFRDVLKKFDYEMFEDSDPDDRVELIAVFRQK